VPRYRIVIACCSIACAQSSTWVRYDRQHLLLIARSHNLEVRLGLSYGVVKQEDGVRAMLETTLLVVSGKKLTVPRLLKRILQVAIAVALTAAVFLLVIVGNGLLVGRQASLQAGINLWLAFIKRPDILATMVLTALVTVLFVYWQRNQERRAGSADRMHS
jgi:hypothetical protein